MIYALLAHLRLRGNHRHQVWVGGYLWRYCLHLSHTGRRPRRCYRWRAWDGYCAEHNRSCYGYCSTDDKEGTTHG